MKNGTHTPTALVGSPTAFCPDCGQMVAVGAKFCSSCGQTLGLVAPAPPITGLSRTATEPIAPSPAAPAASAAAPKRHLLTKARAVVVAGLVLGLGAVGAYAALGVSDHGAASARKALVAGRGIVVSVTPGVNTMEHLSDVRALGSAASRADSRLTLQLQVVAGLETNEKTQAAKALLRTEHRALSALASLKSVDPRHIASWPVLRERIAERITAMKSASAGVHSLGTPAQLTPPAVQLASSLMVADRVVADARTKLRGWERRYRTAKRRQRVAVRNLSGYASSVNGELVTYSGLRDDLDNWITQYGAETLAYGQAGDYLIAAADKRKDVRDALDTQNPPASIADEQASLVAVLSDAIVAMGDAGDAARSCTVDPSCLGEDFRDTPDWQSFHDASQRITAQYGATYARWQAAVAKERHSIEHRLMPQPPLV
jgi:hypothetical protein